MQLQRFDTRQSASSAAAVRLRELLQSRLATGDPATLIVSGGSTPAATFAELARADIDWPNVTVLASDERWVSADHGDSNERMIRETLIVDAAADATMLGYYRTGRCIGDRCRELDKEIRALPGPYAGALLGMGADGHFASLFPDMANLEDALDVDYEQWAVAVNTEASPHPRISLTMPVFADCKEIVLLFFGADKFATFERALQDASRYPIGRLLSMQHIPIHVYWAP